MTYNKFPILKKILVKKISLIYEIVIYKKSAKKLNNVWNPLWLWFYVGFKSSERFPNRKKGGQITPHPAEGIYYPEQVS